MGDKYCFIIHPLSHGEFIINPNGHAHNYENKKIKTRSSSSLSHFANGHIGDRSHPHATNQQCSDLVS
ncbi:hypothetical protein BLOT_015972 [Blomia tropicalis]|nr:hypothetical protein BLOT_015972 [Blomia tropicalis]